MGCNQSTPNSYSALPDDVEAKRPNPYGVHNKSREIRLNSSYRTLYEGMIGLIQENKYADMVLVCGTDRYPVHRAIVCPRSKYFENGCAYETKGVDYFSPGSPIKLWIDPSICESHILAAVLTFLYTLDYTCSGSQLLSFGLPEEPEIEPEPETPSLSNTDVEVVEDETDFSAFSELEEYSATVPSPPSSTTPTSTPKGPSNNSDEMVTNGDPSEAPNELVFHFSMYRAAVLFDIVSLQDVAKEKFQRRLRLSSDGIIPCIREVYREENSEAFAPIRREVLTLVKTRFYRLKATEGWDELVMDFPAFSSDILKRL
ncbi:uncharacterized protein BDR25DRAFT_346783 [Lindgomyces ingoldianus]|uniref:Uncharacterized protein n=1 Tax=Lindgomyces ingoldianus TaxID=673940 RepID=A0ACB6QB76_9PLEO|nr:uncharacterized protein BDR25DRAFT_346783 [Lindgomyces ingoldianus]KAF2464294.1 hypothetical protein BDR25DRAFT_346783 [Lindgomyces ingoldianus]